MEFDRNRVYSAVNADELEVGDKVITAQQLSNLKYQVSQHDYYVWTIKEIKEETYSDRFVTGNGAFPLVYLIERTRNCTNCRLCNGSIKDNPTQVCENYEPQVEPPVNCETCSKADTDRCPVPNPPKKTGCVHWEPKPARVCENCRNLERHGKDNNWCEVREIKLSDEAIKKNTCGHLKLVKSKTEQKAEPTYKWVNYRPFKDIDELIKKWWNLNGWSKEEAMYKNKLKMPLLWVRKKLNFSGLKGELITRFEDSYVDVNGRTISLHVLFTEYEFLDGSPCGVEE